VTERLLTASEVADILAVRESWVREATRAGHLPHLRLGRYIRYEHAAIHAWLEDQRHGPPPRPAPPPRSRLAIPPTTSL
jgi:excisionase family DNA binding protein